jgi:hypothetical protein
VKLSGPAFECIAAEILHFLAVIVIDAFEVSKSLWCHGTDIGSLRTPLGLANQVITDDIICDICEVYSTHTQPWDALVAPNERTHSENNMDSQSFKSIICDMSNCTRSDLSNFTSLGHFEGSIRSENSISEKSISEESISEKSFAFNYMSNYPPPMEVDEEGKHVCVIIPRHIKDAAVRLGMKPLLDDQRWEVSEGRTKKEEVKEALLMYDLSLDDESSMLDEDSESSMSGEESDESGEYESSESGSEPGSESEFESEPESD